MHHSMHLRFSETLETAGDRDKQEAQGPERSACRPDRSKESLYL